MSHLNQPQYNIPGSDNFFKGASVPVHHGFGNFEVAAQAQPMAPGFGNFAGAAQAQPMPPGFLNFSGFEDSASFTPMIQPPINPYFVPENYAPPPYERTIPTCTAITDDEVQMALNEYVNKKCCYGSSSEIDIRDIQMRSEFKYQLVTFTEQRETVWKSEPYTNQQLGPPSGGRTLGPWEIGIRPDQSFTPQVKKIQMPNTSCIKPCNTCCGNGRVRCNSCSGFGGSNCTWCNGTGRRDRAGQNENCSSCNGTGRQRCTWCSGHGLSKCKECNGKGQLYVYLQLIVSWKPYVGEFISDSTSTAIPKKLLSKAKGKRAITEQNTNVVPFSNFPDSSINNASSELIQKHAREYTAQSIILEQKQSVDIVRIAEITYSWKEKLGTFHVYGENNNVYFPNYPDTCSCTIM